MVAAVDCARTCGAASSMQLASAQASSVRLCLVERCVDFMTSPSQGRSMWDICQRDLFVIAVIVVSTCPCRSAGGGHACLPPCLIHAGIAPHQLRDQRFQWYPVAPGPGILRSALKPPAPTTAPTLGESTAHIHQRRTHPKNKT